MPRRPVRAALVAVIIGLATLSACGGDESPSQAVPELADHLEDVDAALAEGDRESAQDALTDLVEAARDAAASGDLSASEADEILTAAERLESRLAGEPAPEPAPESPSEEPVVPEETQPEETEPEETGSTEVVPEESEEDGNEGEGNDDKPEKEDKEEKDKPDKGKGGKGKG